jgi:hypothetical protein
MAQTDMARLAVVSGLHTPVGQALPEFLRAPGWHVVDGADRAAVADAGGQYGGIDALVYDPGLLHDGSVRWTAAHVAAVLDGLDQFVAVARRYPRHRSAGGTSIVAVGSRDALGWADRGLAAAASASLVATVRSLALTLGRDGAGVTANVVLGPAPETDQEMAPEPPQRLTPHPVTARDVAEAVAFFAQPDNRYITGQVLYVCGGSDLLSSLSV